tara:strand:- start:1563 stop:2516 length:954 start_codon:yes stop_codon:yes gene_type:complete
MISKLVGVTFAVEENPKLKKLRPVGSVTFKHEPFEHPSNPDKNDPNAVAIYYKGDKLGYCKSEPYIQEACMSVGTAKIIDYAYWDSELGFNEDHIGQFQSLKFEIEEKYDEDTGKIIGARYTRCTKFLKYFDPYGGGDGLIKWAFMQGNTFEQYEEALNECAENGTQMHDAIEKYFDSDTYRSNLLPEGWDKFVEKYNPEWVYGEERFYDNKLMITGQPDFVGYIDWKGQRIRAVVDWKSSKRVSLKHKIQASIYSMNCLIDEQPIEGALIVAFGADTKQGFSVGYVSREQIESNYLAMEYVRKALDAVGVETDEFK